MISTRSRETFCISLEFVREELQLKQNSISIINVRENKP